MFQRDFGRTLNIVFILLYLLHMKMKKMLFGAFLGVFALAGAAFLPNVASATDATDWSQPWGAAGDRQEISWQTLTWSALLDTIKNAINWVLGILATIALVICIYGGFLMVTAAGDEKKYQKGLGVLKYAAIGLAIIGLSWMIVSVIFRFVNTLWKWNQTWSEAVGAVDTSAGTATSLRNAWATADGWGAAWDVNPS